MATYLVSRSVQTETAVEASSEEEAISIALDMPAWDYDDIVGGDVEHVEKVEDWHG